MVNRGTWYCLLKDLDALYLVVQKKRGCRPVEDFSRVK